MSNSWISLFFVVALGASSVACDGGGGDGQGGSGAQGGTGGQGGTGAQGGTGGQGGAGGGDPAHVDLFACGLSPDCEKVIFHLGAEPYSALECAAKHIISAQPGVLGVVDAPGPTLNETERLIVLLGDGTALVQSRHRECQIDDDCDPPPAWEPSSAHQICNVVLGDGVETACADGTPNQCAWSPWGPGELEGCMDVEDRACADVTALLE